MQGHPSFLKPGDLCYSLCTDEVYSSNDFTVYIYLGRSGPNQEAPFFFPEEAYVFSTLFQLDEPMTDIHHHETVHLYAFCLIYRYSQRYIQQRITLAKSGQIGFHGDPDFNSMNYHIPVSRILPVVPLKNVPDAFDAMYEHAHLHHANKMDDAGLYFPKQFYRDYFIEKLSPYVHKPFFKPSPSLFI